MLIELSSICFNSSFISGNTEDKSPHSLCSLALLVASGSATTGTAVIVKVKVWVVELVALVAVIV